MIIKSMSRKSATFGQLLNYMEDGRHDKRFTIDQNVFSRDKDKVKEAFEYNASFFNLFNKKLKDGVYMYHDIISITKNNELTEERQKECLREIVLEYISKRAENNLVYAVLHTDKADNLHYHIMISSNEVEKENKHRLSKFEYDKIKKELESHVLEKYPELKQAKIINKPATEKLSNKGAELKRRTGKTPQRESVKERLKTIFDSAKTKQEFFEQLEKHKLEIYVRGKTISVLDKENNRKHRLKTLGMLDDFNRMSDLLEKVEPQQKTEKEPSYQENTQPYKEKVRVKSRAKEEPPKTKEKTQKNKSTDKEQASTQKQQSNNTKSQQNEKEPLSDYDKEVQRRIDLFKKMREDMDKNDHNYEKSYNR